jgi:hypothetical protein
MPTRANLIHRRVLQDNGDQGFIFCGERMETTHHLFLYCNFTLQVWSRICAWLGFNLQLPLSSTSLLNLMAAITGSKQKRKGMVLIWTAAIWAIWRHRNKIIFDNGANDLASLVDDIKISSWNGG